MIFRVQAVRRFQVASNGVGNSCRRIFEVHADNTIRSNYLYLNNLFDIFQTIFIVHIIIRDLCLPCGAIFTTAISYQTLNKETDHKRTNSNLWAYFSTAIQC